jgi:stringent starvation protein B
MKASRPYLLRAIYGWIVDNGLTPYLLVDADIIHVEVPREHVSNGKIVLNVDPKAVEELELANDAVSFSARFARGHLNCYVPIPAVLAIYASENGKGMFFNDEDLGSEPFAIEDNIDDAATKQTGRSAAPVGTQVSHLTVVK